MNTTHHTAAIEGDKNMVTNRQTTIKESKMKITASNVIRWSGLAAVAAGIIFAGIQPIHPPDVLASVSTDAWAIITPLKTVMAFLFLLGITGLYARQVNKAGWMGLVGYLLLSLCWSIQLAFIFAEAFIFPPLATPAPQFVEGLLAVVSGQPTEISLGALPALFALAGGLYMLGGLLFGIATFRAGILSRWAAGLLAVASTLTPLATQLPHEFQRLAGMPVGLALAWLGYALWSQRQANIAETSTDVDSPQLRQSIAK